MNDSIPVDAINRAGRLVGTSTTVGFNHLLEKLKSLAAPEDCFDDDFFRENAGLIFETVNDLKGVPLKVIQVLSLDHEILPESSVSTLSQSHHSVSPLPYSKIWESFVRSFNRSPDEIFETFSEKAQCAASIGQVHKATFNGHDFAVKIKYPGIETTFESDLKYVKPLLSLIGFPRKTAQSFINEISERLHEEADYQFELRRSAEISTACCGNIENVEFAQYYPDVSSNEILTMDWLPGIPLDQFAAAEEDQQIRDQIGQALWDFTLYQIQELQLFHADPNPGNYLVHNGKLQVLDFGCTKQMDKDSFRKQFEPLRPGVLDSEKQLAAALQNLTEDFSSEEHYSIFATVGKEVVEILSRPFRADVFDFGDPDFIQDVFGIHHTFSKDPLLRRGLGFSSSPDAVFLSRTWLGLYRLLARIGARVRVDLPEWMND
ncbi:MAG: AarF/UbiB family protein [Verrucomicrobiales bacterium]|nr:AarF/UbiB family protein [Verrucomicrobiales bacterium]